MQSRSESLDRYITEMGWGVADLVQHMVERRREFGKSGIHTLNGNADTDLKQLFTQVTLGRKLLPVGICAEIAWYLNEKPADRLQTAEGLFVRLQDDETDEWDTFRTRLANEVSDPPPDDDLPPGNPASSDKGPGAKKGRKPRSSKAQKKRGAAALDAAITAAGDPSYREVARKCGLTDVKKMGAMANRLRLCRLGKAVLPDDLISVVATALNTTPEVLRGGAGGSDDKPAEKGNRRGRGASRKPARAETAASPARGAGDLPLTLSVDRQRLFKLFGDKTALEIVTGSTTLELVVRVEIRKSDFFDLLNVPE